MVIDGCSGFTRQKSGGQFSGWILHLLDGYPATLKLRGSLYSVIQAPYWSNEIMSTKNSSFVNHCCIVPSFETIGLDILTNTSCQLPVLLCMLQLVPKSAGKY